ncbi:MAG TPA: hypothetical protein VLA53_04625 [Nitrosopumilaceae archaeon]|nr:hypothetical protein [Nitrosopumilaceae archaeon]
MKKPVAFIMLLSMAWLIIGGHFFSAYAEPYSIPSWIKNNAKWWSNGQIEDSEFVKGIQYLIENGIMAIPETKSSVSQSSQQIPTWIKNNAGWWADNKISDSDFVSGIQYLINNGIIRISPDFVDNEQNSTKRLSISLEGKNVVQLGGTQYITVKVTDGKNLVTDASVSAKVIYSYGDTIKNFEGVSNYYGEFRFSWKIEGYTPGIYTVLLDVSKSGYTSTNGLFSFRVLGL